MHRLKPYKNEIKHRYIDLQHSARMIAKDYSVHHGLVTSFLKSLGVSVRDRNQSAKYTWSNHKHPNIGKTGENSFMFGRKLSVETKTKIGLAHKGEKHHNWSGGKKIHSSGYVMVYKPNHVNADKEGFVHEHRVEMENFIGRPLQSNEIVHHIDGDKNNNDINNLALMNRSAHAKLHSIERKKQYE